MIRVIIIMMVIVATACGCSSSVSETAKSPSSKSCGQDSEPLLLVRISPGYPGTAWRQCAEGFVHLEGTVTTDGSVTDVHVLESQPAGVFDAAAIDAFGKWKFSRACKDGERVSVQIDQVMNFRLSDHGEFNCIPEQDEK